MFELLMLWTLELTRTSGSFRKRTDQKLWSGSREENNSALRQAQLAAALYYS